MTISTSGISASKSISATELFIISQEISRKFSPVVSVKSSDLTRRIALTPKELREISEEITRKYVPTLKSKTSNVVVLPIDPENLFVFWNLGQTETISGLEDKPKDIVLRIYPKLEELPITSKVEAWVDVDLDRTKTRQKVPLPKGQQAYSYTAAIGLRDEDKQLTTLATSKAIHTPRGNTAMHTASENKTLSTNSAQFSSNQDRLQNLNKSASGQSAK
jgi:hypothetical protein